MLARLVLLSFLVTGCSSGPPRTITWDDLKDPAPLKNQNVILEGYPGVYYPASNSHSGEQTFVLMDTAAGRSASAQRQLAASAPAGSSPNQVEPLPQSYSEKDLKVHCADGNVAGIADKVRVEGWIEIVYGPEIHVKRIEKL